MLPSKDKACYEAGWGVWSNFFMGQCYCKFSFGVSVSNVSAPISKWHPGVFFPTIMDCKDKDKANNV